VLLCVLVLVPVGGLALLLANPGLDVMYQHDPTHFWLVLTAALLNVGLGILTGTAAAVSHPRPAPAGVGDYRGGGTA
jgi:hypothetical protein